MNSSASNSNVFVATAPGKIILTGEHFVVHGSYAVAAAINKRARVTVSASKKQESQIVSEGMASPAFEDDGQFVVVKSVLAGACEEYGRPRSIFQVQIDSEIPQGSGLGSSAAIAVAASAALTSFMGKKLSNDQIWELATRAEKSVHGNPSGIDTRASLSGGIFLFNRKSGAKPIVIRGGLQFLVVFSGKTRSTSELISRVGESRNMRPASFKHLAKAASFLSLQAVDALTNGDLPHLGCLMDLSQLSLSWIGVSSNELDDLIENLRTVGVLGAKITGAGGGGSIIALPKANESESLLKKTSLDYVHAFLTSVPQEGLRWEK